MTESLSALLEDGEELLYPVYGTLRQKHNHWFVFFGLTEHCLLIALLKGNSKEIDRTAHVPLDIKKVTVKRRILFPMCKIDIDFTEGNAGHFLISEKVFGMTARKKC